MKDIIKVLFYKDGAMIVSINLINGNYFIPTIEIELDKKEIKKELKRKFKVDVSSFDLINENASNYLFIGEWEGTYGIDDEVLRSKWVKIKEIKDDNIKLIRAKYADIVDIKGDVIGIAPLQEVKKYNLRYRAIKNNDELHILILGESPSDGFKRLGLKDNSFGHLDKKENCFIYEVE